MARFIALDWDQNQLHVLSADVTKGVVRVKKAVVWQQAQIPNPANAEDLGRLLREHLREAGIAPAPVLACIGRDRLIVKEIRFPAVPDVEEPAVVRFQAVKELTEAAEDVVIDYVLAGNTKTTLSNDRKATALVVRKEVLHAYQTLCETAGLKLIGLTPRLLGSATCLNKVMGTTVLTPAPTPPDGVIAVASVGEKLAEFSILKGEMVLLTRSLPSSAALPGEIRRNLAVHAGQQPHLPVVALYLTGRGSGELRQRLSEMTEVPVYVFDPFSAAGNPEVVEMAGAQATPQITPAERLDAIDAPKTAGTTNRGTFAGAMGLLYLKSMGNLPVNFVSPRQPKPPANPNFRHIRLALVAGIALFVGLVVLGRFLHASWADELAQMEQDNQRLDRQLFDSKMNAQRLKAIEEWDTLVWLDELYDLNARIPNVDSLRVTSITTEPLQRGDGKSKSKAIAKLTVKGKLLDRREVRKSFDELVSKFSTEAHYTVTKTTVDNDKFTLEVEVERRAPSDYRHVVKPEAPRVMARGPGRGENGAGAQGEDDPGEDEDPEERFRKMRAAQAKEKQDAAAAAGRLATDKGKMRGPGGKGGQGGGGDEKGGGKVKGKGKGKTKGGDGN